MEKKLRELLVLPTWLIIKIARIFFRAGDPWKKHRFSLSEWAARSTPANLFFSAYFWGAGLFLVVAFLKLKRIL